MAPKPFLAQVAGAESMTLRNLRYIAAESIQDVMEAAQTPQVSVKRTGGAFEVGKIPVDTSALINSLTSEGIAGAESYTVAIAGMEIGDTLRFAWTSDHALPMELGFTAKNGTQVPGRHFVGANAARFSEFVADHVAEVNK